MKEKGKVYLRFNRLIGRTGENITSLRKYGRSFDQRSKCLIHKYEVECWITKRCSSNLVKKLSSAHDTGDNW
jgi:hypothetical protein